MGALAIFIIIFVVIAIGCVIYYIWKVRNTQTVCNGKAVISEFDEYLTGTGAINTTFNAFKNIKCSDGKMLADVVMSPGGTMQHKVVASAVVGQDIMPNANNVIDPECIGKYITGYKMINNEIMFHCNPKKEK